MNQNEQKIDFVVYDANLFLKLSMIDNNEIVWVLSKNCVVQMDWDQPIKPDDYSGAKKADQALEFLSK